MERLLGSYKFACTFYHDTDRSLGASLPRMENTLCDISALLFWRTPPLARLIAAGPDDHALLSRLAGPSRLAELRADLAACSPLGVQASSPASWHAHYGERSRALLNAGVLTAVPFDGPVDVLASEPGDRLPTRAAHPRVWRDPLSPHEVVLVTPGLRVASPSLALQQVASRATLTRTVMLASELCGGFSIYRPPEPLREFLQELADEGLLPSYGGWRAALDNDGRLTGLWTHAPLVSPDALSSQAAASGEPRGRARLAQAAALVRPGAASPFEVQTGMLLGLSRRRGGEGYEGFTHNRRVALSPAAARIAHRRACYCDVYWDGPLPNGAAGLDLECQSSSHHFGAMSSVSDANRATALQMMGIEVTQVTFSQIADPATFEIFSGHLAERLGAPRREKTEAQLRDQEDLRRELFVDWAALPMV